MAVVGKQYFSSLEITGSLFQEKPKTNYRLRSRPYSDDNTLKVQEEDFFQTGDISGKGGQTSVRMWFSCTLTSATTCNKCQRVQLNLRKNIEHQNIVKTL